MECLLFHLPRDLVNIVHEYYTTFDSMPNINELRWRSLLDYIAMTLSTLGVTENYSYILYKFYDYHMLAWAALRKKIIPRHYELFGLLVLHRVAPVIFEYRGQSIFEFVLARGYALSDIAVVDELLQLPVCESALFMTVTSVLNSACLDSPLSVSILRTLLSKAPAYNYCHAEILFLWIFSVANRLHLKIKIPTTWTGMGSNLRPRLNYIPLHLFYGVGPTTVSRLQAATLGSLSIITERPPLVSRKLWSDFCRLLQ